MSTTLTPETKNADITITPETKSDTALTMEVKRTVETTAKFGTAKFGMAKFGTSSTYTDLTYETKN